MKVIPIGNPQYSPDQLQKAQLKDPDLSKFVHWLEADEEPLINDLYLCSPAVKSFGSLSPNLKCKMGSFYYQWEDNPVKLLLITLPPLMMKFCRVAMIVPQLGT